ncbi:MAG: helix-turn-helix transcriptional regulator [Oscillospiraceae bacterium]|nr:helix-turn-helix transcriptional regulator [Oscillospiraceae bacterium]
MTLQEKLYKLRRQAGYSQEELAEKLGVSRQAVSKWERGESSPDINNAAAIAALYDVSLDDLVRGTESIHIDMPSNSKGISLKKPYMAESSGVCGNEFVAMSIPDNNGDIMPPGYYSKSDDTVSEKYPSAEAAAIADIPQSVRMTGSVPMYKDNEIPKQAAKPKKVSVANKLISVMSANGSKTAVPPQRKAYFDKFRKFPYWALALLLFLFIMGIGIQIRAEALIGISAVILALSIPLYYTTIKALERRNPMYFAYPVFITMVFFVIAAMHEILLSGWYGDMFGASAVACFLSIPLYYTGIAACRKRKCKYFCFPVFIVMLYVCMGIVWNDAFVTFLWLYGLIPFYYIYSSQLDKLIFGRIK